MAALAVGGTLGLGLAGLAVLGTVAFSGAPDLGMYGTAPELTFLSPQESPDPVPSRHADAKSERLAPVAADGLASDLRFARFAPEPSREAAEQIRAAVLAARSRTDRFQAVAAHAALTPAKLASLFSKAGKGASSGDASAGGGRLITAARLPAREPKPIVASRMTAAAPAKHGTPAPSADVVTVAVPPSAHALLAEPPAVSEAEANAAAELLLAFAAPSGQVGAKAALSSILRDPTGQAAAEAEDARREQDIASLPPEFEITPDDGPLPGLRPRGEPEPRASAPAAAPGDDEKAVPRAVEKPDRTREAARTRMKPKAPAREESQGSGFGDAMRNLFGGGGKAGNGIAVYDISAAKVYMPDGSVLEAHSGIGRMADNPRYVHVKMKGPTPPHVYNLRMREKRFHGVEAIRMLPVDGRNKHGRDGFLTHSYLLRGRAEQSHGCVAFKEYDRFLSAFKRGRVKQLVVVPRGGQAAGMRMASAANRI